MRKISESDFVALENYCNCACEALVGNVSPKADVFSLIELLEEKLKFDTYSKVEKNFGYVYYDVSNFDELTEIVKVLESTEELFVDKYNFTLGYSKEYKLLVNDKVVLLALEQNLKRICIREGVKLELPVYIIREVTVKLLNNGIDWTLFSDCFEDIEKLDFMEVESVKEVLKSIPLVIKTSDVTDTELKIYMDGELIYKDETDAPEGEIASFLEKNFRTGNITAEDFKFTKSRVEDQNLSKKRIYANFYFEDMASNNLLKKLLMGSGYLIVDTKKVKYELTNNSKIKIVISRHEFCLDNKEIELYDVIENLKKSNKNIKAYYIDKFTNSHSMYSSIRLCTQTGDALPKEKPAFVPKHVAFSVKKENGMFLPCDLTLRHGNFVNEVIYENIKVNNEFDKNEITLIQYFYFEELKKEGKQKYILRMVYNLKKGDLYFGTEKLENIILPIVEENECCLIYLSEKFDISDIDLNESKLVCSPNPIYDTIEKIFDINCGKKDYEIYTLVEDLDLYSDKKEITFFELESSALDTYYVEEVYDGEFTIAEIEFLKEYYI